MKNSIELKFFININSVQAFQEKNGNNTCNWKGINGETN